MERPILFMLNPWFDNGNQGPFYCPDCGIVEGLLLEVVTEFAIILISHDTI